MEDGAGPPDHLAWLGRRQKEGDIDVAQAIGIIPTIPGEVWLADDGSDSPGDEIGARPSG